MAIGERASFEPDVQAMFEALCRVEGATRANDGPAVALRRLAEEIGPAKEPSPRRTPAREPAHERPREDRPSADRRSLEVAPRADDDFPDFSAAPPFPEAPGRGAEPLSSDGAERSSRGQASSEAEAFTGGQAPSPDSPERDALVRGLHRALGEYHALLARYSRDFDEVFARRARGEAESDDVTLQRLRAAQALLLKYPVASQAAFAALAREGRRFAETEEGMIWKRRLADSPLVAKARTMFEGLSGGLVGEGQGPLPSSYVDAFLRALDRDLETLLAELGGIRNTK